MYLTAATAVLSLAALGQAELSRTRLNRHGYNITLPHGPLPHNSTANSTRCTSLTSATQDDWQQANTNAWLSNWLKTNADAISNSGFISTFADLVLGQPGWTCELGGSCELPCIRLRQSTSNNNNLEARDTSSGTLGQQAANVGSSLQNLNSAFSEMQALFATAIGQTNSVLNGIIGDFWFEADTSSLDLTNGLHALGTVIGLVAAFATGGAAAPAGVLTTLYNGGVTQATSTLPA
jgi:hypothetical protein